jgi:hypothetical protein
MTYTLYDNGNNVIAQILLYLDFLNYDLEPEFLEKDILNFPEYITCIPSIVTCDGTIFSGERECVLFYYNSTNILHLREKAENFVNTTPRYYKNLKKIKID